MFNINNPYRQGSRYLRNSRQGPIGAAIDLSITPAFPSIGTGPTLTATPSTTGGTLAAGTYGYRATALNVRGESLPSVNVNGTTTGTTGSVALTWSAVTGASGYNIYRGGLLLATVGAVTAYTDTGANTPAGAINAVDTTSVITGAVAGQVNAGDMVYRTGAGIASLNNAGSANSNAANFLGVSEETYPLVLGLGQGLTLGKPTNDPMSVRVAIRTSGEFAFDTTPGDVYAPGAAVYLGADAQTVTTAAVGTTIGYVADDQNPVLNAADGFSATITGGTVLGGQAARVCVVIKPPAAA